MLSCGLASTVIAADSVNIGDLSYELSNLFLYYKVLQIKPNLIA